ncbi:MAG: hypothetical protein RL757_810 [Bacteroidota bacterium]|jgi:tRNA pseudouridine32 synthase/23S rRNA pseudouridine746 synthase
MSQPEYFTKFEAPIDGYTLPQRFTFPFYYEPHPLSLLAAKELQHYIETQNDWYHNFGFDGGDKGWGKMFGVLVVQKSDGEIGYLAAFSGKLGFGNRYAHFVPPVFDMLEDNSFYRIGEMKIHEVTQKIEKLEQNEALQTLKDNLQQANEKAVADVAELKINIKLAKIERDVRRKEAQNTLSDTELQAVLTALDKESIQWNFRLKDLVRASQHEIAVIQASLDVLLNEIADLKTARSAMSGDLQQQLFSKYVFLNQRGEQKDLRAIFDISDALLPPSGAGECAAPKLLQYAFLHQLKPISMAEFWWGQAPSSEIRKHKQFYPACKGKCEPILGHMLSGMELDPNPFLINHAEGKMLEIVFEDDHLLLVNKPAEFLSVPGRKVSDSVYTRVKALYPQATGPLIVHRLDMSTSGLLLLAKDKDVHEHLQKQFISRKIKKRYVALLDGVVELEKGFIDLPLCVDWDERPRQMVSYEHGKPAQTKWKRLEKPNEKGQTKIQFYPITGRTHQLRVHAAHPKGLNAPIVGDDLYGNTTDRLYLHAEYLEFMHPVTRQMMKISVDAPF